MHEIDGVPHYYNVPEAWLPDLGRLAILSGRMEHQVDQISQILGLRPQTNGRTNSFGVEAKRIRDNLERPEVKLVLQALLPGWAERVRDWTLNASQALNETRNLFLHAQYFHCRSDTAEWYPAMQKRLDLQSPLLNPITRVSGKDLAEAVERLTPIERAGSTLWADSLSHLLHRYVPIRP